MQKLQMCVRYCEIVSACTITLYLLFVTGCGPGLSSPELVREFEQAGPIKLGVHIDGVTGRRDQVGPYCVVPGDILRFQMPTVLRVITSDLSEWLRPVRGHKDVEPYLVRVSEAGTITLPIVGKIPVAGKTLAEIESLVINAYFPKYIVNTPMLVCEVAKYQSENERAFAVMGLVHSSGVFPYPADVQYNLMEAMAFAGGLNMVADPRYVKIYRQGANGEIVSATFGIGAKSLSEAYSVMIKPGDLIYVDHTLRTRMNQFLADVFRVTVGVGGNYTLYE